MKHPRLSRVAASLAADAVCARLDGGYLRLYAGEQPSAPDAPAGESTWLAELRFATPAFAPAVAGIAAAHPIAEDPAARGNGEAAWFRTLAADGAAICDGSVSTTDADLTLDTVHIVEGVRVLIGSFHYRQNRGT